VPDVQIRIGLLQYVHPTSLIDSSALPPPNDQWEIFCYHHMPPDAQALAQSSSRSSASLTA